MPADYYGGDETPAKTEASPGPEQDNVGKTDILPKTFFPEQPKPGDRCTIEIVRVHDDSVECRYAENGQESGPPTKEPEPDMGRGRMASMMEA